MKTGEEIVNVVFGPFRFSGGNSLLYRDGAEVPLAPRALAVLEHLAGRPNQIVSKQALIEAVWKDTYVEEASLKEAVSRLREALDDDPQRPKYIETVHRRGYRLRAAVPSAASSNGAGAAADTGRVNPKAPRLWLVAGLLAGLIAGAGATAWVLRRPPRADAQPIRFSVALPPGYVISGDMPSSIAFSHDGRRIAIAARRAAGEESALFVRDLDRLETRAVAGSDGALGPFFSPDDSAIGFYAYGKLKRVPAGGGTPTDICQLPFSDYLGADWGPRGDIVFGSGLGLMRVAATGGAASPVTHIDATLGETGHWWPRFLPGGDRLLFTAWTNALDRARVETVSATGGARARIMDGASDARYADGHLIVARSDGPAVAPFDPASGRVTGDVTPLGLPVLGNPYAGVTELSVSAAGAIAYAPGTSTTPASHVIWLGARRAEPSVFPVRPFRNIALSPDAARIATTISAPASYDVWIGDVDRGTLTRLTSAGRNIEPVWSPDGTWVAFASSVTTPFAVVRRHADGSGGVETIFSGPYEASPTSWSPDGRVLLIERFDPATGFDLYTVPLEGPRTPEPFIRTRFHEMDARFSPDGRWVAYESDESGAGEVYVCRYPTAGERWQVSADGGSTPFWSRDGRTIYYKPAKGGTGLIAATFASGNPPAVGRGRPVEAPDGVDWRAAAPDGRIVGVEQWPSEAPARVDVVVGWRPSK